MNGWRDADGRTAADRRKREDAATRARWAARLRHRPLSLVRSALGAAFIAVLIIALLFAFR